MSNWISKLGKWFPAKEYVVDPSKPKGKEIYEGPDRAAMQDLKEAGFVNEKGEITEYFGKDIYTDPELIQRSRQLGFSSLDEYLKMYSFNKDSAELKFKQNMEIIRDHKQTEPKAVPYKDSLAGTGKGVPQRQGGFDLPADASAAKGLQK